MRRNKRLLPAPRMPKRQRLRSVIRWILYTVIVLLAFVTAAAGDYTKPLLLIPIALCIASVHGTVIAGCTGIVCGLLMDIAGGTLLGYHAIFMFLMCIGISILYDRLMQQRFLNLVFFTLLAAFVVTGCDFVFQYALWGYDNVSKIYINHSLPCLFYTVIGGAVCYPVFRLIHRFLLPQRRRKVERTLKPIHDE